MSNYGEILEELLRYIKKEDGRDPASVNDKYRHAIAQGMAREAVCQILADVSPEVRKDYFARYPELEQYYPIRIQNKKK